MRAHWRYKRVLICQFQAGGCFDGGEFVNVYVVRQLIALARDTGNQVDTDFPEAALPQSTASLAAALTKKSNVGVWKRERANQL